MESILQRLYNYWWNQKLRELSDLTKENSDIINQDNPFGKLRFILGIGRSGTTWVAQTIAKTKVPLRYYEEPLYHINPRLNLNFSNQKYDHTAIDYCSSLSPNHRLISSYQILADQNIPQEFLSQNFIKRFDKNFRYTLIKEVHSLLSIESLIKHFSSPFILILRSPFRIVDSLIVAQGYESFYLKGEYKNIKNNTKLKKLLLNIKNLKIHECCQAIDRYSEDNKKKVLQLLLTISVIQSLFKLMSQKYAHVLSVNYESICEQPNENFNKISDFLGLDYQENNYIFQGESISPYSLVRKTVQQNLKPLHNFSEADIGEYLSFFQTYNIGVCD